MPKPKSKQGEQDWRGRLAEASKALWADPEYRERQRKARQASQVFHQAAKQKLDTYRCKSSRMAGKTHSQEARQAIGQAVKEQWQQGKRDKERIRSLHSYRDPEKVAENMRRIGQQNKGRKPPNWAQVEITCIVCDKTQVVSPSRKDRQFCSKGCALRSRSIGGEYDDTFTYTLRKRIRERDQNRCRICGQGRKPRGLVIHHLDYDKQNSDERNLITLCRSCHIRGHRIAAWPLTLAI